MDLVGAKVLVLFLLGFLKLAAGLAPLALTKYLTRRRKQRCLNRFIGLVLCFGGGILLSTVFVHMIKEVRDSLDEAIGKGIFETTDLHYPFAELLICIGFLLILFLEAIVHKFFGDHEHFDLAPPPGSPPTACSSEDIPGGLPRLGSSSGLDNQAYENEYSKNGLRRHVAIDDDDQHPDQIRGIKSSPSLFGKTEERNVYNVSSCAVLTSYTDAEGLSMAASSPSPTNTTNSSDSPHCSRKNSIHRQRSILSSVRGFLVVLALSVHSLFEGMAIGLEETSSGVWKLFTAVIIHAVAIVFCIGTEMIAGGTRTRTLVMYMVVLGLNAPVGVAIGLIVTLHVETASAGHLLAVGILQGLAGGTLLYITFFEVLSRDKLVKYGMTGLLGCLAIIVGFVAMAGSEGMGHGHSHSLGGGGGRTALESSAAGHGHGHSHDIPLSALPTAVEHGDTDFNFNPYEDDNEKTSLARGRQQGLKAAIEIKTAGWHEIHHEHSDHSHDHAHEHDHAHDHDHDHDYDHNHLDHDHDHNNDHDHDHEYESDNKNDHNLIYGQHPNDNVVHHDKNITGDSTLPENTNLNNHNHTDHDHGDSAKEAAHKNDPRTDHDVQKHMHNNQTSSNQPAQNNDDHDNSAHHFGAMNGLKSASHNDHQNSRNSSSISASPGETVDHLDDHLSDHQDESILVNFEAVPTVSVDSNIFFDDDDDSQSKAN